MRTHLLVLGGSWERAELALGAPAAATIAATLRLGDQIAVGGGHLAHGLQHFCEAESLAGVWAKEERSAVMETVPAPGTTRELQTAGTQCDGTPGLAAGRRAAGHRCIQGP